MANQFWYTINSAQQTEWQESKEQKAFEAMLQSLWIEFIELNPTMESDGVNIIGTLFLSSNYENDKERNDIQCVAVLENVSAFERGAEVKYAVWNPAKRLSSVITRVFE